MDFLAFVSQYLSEEQAHEFVQMYINYSLDESITGTQLWYGAGNNGKTTLARVIKDTLGDQVTIFEDDARCPVTPASIRVCLVNIPPVEDDYNRFDHVFIFNNKFSDSNYIPPTFSPLAFENY